MSKFFFQIRFYVEGVWRSHGKRRTHICLATIALEKYSRTTDILTTYIYLVSDIVMLVYGRALGINDLGDQPDRQAKWYRYTHR